MNKYLLEIGTEELAYKFIPSAMEQLKEEFSKTLNENKIKFDDIKTYASPRRLAVLISGLNEKQDDVKKTIKGPIASIAYDEKGNLTKAAFGFAAKNGINPENLFKKDDYVWAQIEQKGKTAEEILKTAAPDIITKLKGTHFMRWADLDFKFQRPVRWIVSILNSKIIEFEIAGVKAGNVTRGHRFANPKEITISNPDEYLSKLESVNVIADVQKRRDAIVKLAEAAAKEAGAEIVMEEELLNEVTFITEWPVPVVCSFDEKYLVIPEKVLVTVMAVHQRYFPLYKNGKLLNKFITISNFIGNNFDNIKAGNQRVVAARLEDAVFFVHEDTQKPLSAYIDDLKGVTFQKGLGTMKDKTDRIVKLSKCLLEDAKGVKNSESVIRTAELCKADLVTRLVFEFTELQGYIGCDYAEKSGETKEVSKGIKEHYFPLNSDAELASGEEGQIAGTADKIDTITAIFASGRKVSGSADPLGARRAALGILRTMLEKPDLNINLNKLIDEAVKLMPVKIEDPVKLKNDIAEFMKTRLIIYLNTKGYAKDVLEACSEGYNIFENVNLFISRYNTVLSINKNKNAAGFYEAANRVIRIIKNENDFSAPDEKLFKEPEEKELYTAAKSINEDALSYDALSDKLFTLVPCITAFFDKVLVMDKDENIKKNRFNLLNLVKKKFDKIADFSRITV